MMGNCFGDLEKQRIERNRVIEEQMELEAAELRKVIKLLLLGAGECGKSTILKQMRLLNSDGFSDHERESYKASIYANTVGAMSTMLTAMNDLNIQLHNPLKNDCVQLIYTCVQNNEQSEPFTQEIQEALNELWKDDGLKEAYARRSEFQLFDAANYFLDSVDRISAIDYEPTEQDMLYVRVKTIGIVEVHFAVKGNAIRVFDVGGQRSQRRKWIHCFDDVHAIIFIAAVNEYDQVLEEDSLMNRLIEAMNLFETIVNSCFFVGASMILFLNKTDLFLEKIKTRPLTVVFPDFTGPHQEYAPAMTYIEQQFTELNKNPNKKVYMHQTCATDTTQVQVVLDSVLDTIIEHNIQQVGFS